MEAVLGQEGKERLIKRVSMAPWAPVEGFFVTYNPSLITQIICYNLGPTLAFILCRRRKEPTPTGAYYSAGASCTWSFRILLRLKDPEEDKNSILIHIRNKGYGIFLVYS